MAWASTLDKGTTVTASRDTSRAARVLKRAIMVGCNAAGVNVEDLEVATVPVTRHQVRVDGQPGRRHRPAGPERPPVGGASASSTHDGLDLTETAQRKIERLYHREEFRRVLAGEIGDIDFPRRAVELYTADLVGAVDLSPRPGRRFKMVLDVSYGSASFVMPNLLAKLDADVLVVNPYADTPGIMASRPPGQRRPGGRPGAGLGGPPGRGDRPRRREPRPSSTTRARCSPTTRPSWCCWTWW